MSVVNEERLLGAVTLVCAPSFETLSKLAIPCQPTQEWEPLHDFLSMSVERLGSGIRFCGGLWNC